MNFFKISLISLIILSSQAFAKEEAHIITGSSASSVLLTENQYGDGYDASFGVQVGYDYAFSSGLQLGGEMGVSIFDGGSMVTLLVGPGYNFNTDVENSFYASVKGGFVTTHIDSADSQTDAMIAVELGKRFKLMENVSYVPGISAAKALGSNSSDPAISFDLFRLSLVF